MCRDTCHARIDIPKLMSEAKAAHQAEQGLDWSDWVFARTEYAAAAGSNFAPLVNGLLGRASVRWVLEKVFGLSRRRRLPQFALRAFLKQARGLGLTRKQDANKHPRTGANALPPVALFVDNFANYNDPSIASAAVAVLRHQGIEVYVPPRQSGCGMAPLSQGDVETAREVAERNVRVFADLAREGYRIVTPEPTAAVMLTQDYLNLLDDADTRAVAESTEELTSFLWRLHESGRLRTGFRSLDLSVGHHVPCHVKALHGPIAGPKLLSLIPGLRVHTIDVSCSGMAGVYGLRAKNYAASLAAGRPMLVELDRPRALFGSTECSACRMQMQEGTQKRTLHPIQYLALAYGLLPEIGVKLRRPLSELVSD
jgi:Fe-S oxidoreductase